MHSQPEDPYGYRGSGTSGKCRDNKAINIVTINIEGIIANKLYLQNLISKILLYVDKNTGYGSSRKVGFPTNSRH